MSPIRPKNMDKTADFGDLNHESLSISEQGFVIVSPSGIATDEHAVETVNGSEVNLNPSQRAWTTAASLLAAVYVSAAQVADLEYAVVKNADVPTFSSDPTANPIVWGCGDVGTQFIDVFVRISPSIVQKIDTFTLVQDNNGVCES